MNETNQARVQPQLHRFATAALAVLVAGMLAVVAPSAFADESPAPITKTTAAVTASSAGIKDVGVESNVWGSVSGFDGPAAVSTQVLIDGEWSTSQTQTNVTGAYTLPLTYGASTPGTYTWRVVATANGVTAVSPTFSFIRTAKAAVTASSAGSKVVGAETYVWGSVTGFPGAATVTTQVLIGGKWANSQTKANVTGSYSLPLTYGANTPGSLTWRVVATGGGKWAVSKSFVFTRTAKPVVTASSAGSKVVGAETNAWGSVSGFPAGATVSTQVLIDGKWATSQMRSNVKGSYSIPLTYGANTVGTQTWRVVASGSGLTAVSPTFTLKRTPKPVAGLDKRCLTGRAMCISKAQRKLYWVVNGEVKMSFDVRFGSELTPTRNGAFQVNWKSRNHVSSIYHTPMPYAMFFSGGQAVHYSADFAARGYNGASHGCVNVRDKVKIAKLFDLVRVGDKVIVYTG